MSILRYLKDRVLFFVVNIILFTIVLATMIFLDVGSSIIFVTFFIWFFPLLSYAVMEMNKSYRFYNELKRTSESLDKKYLLAQIIKQPNFIEGKLIYDILKETDKCMHENVNKYKEMQIEYKEYIEAWVHEIKTPIASIGLIIQNNPSEITQNISNEIGKVESFIEQALYYSRCSDVSKDYIIKKFELKLMVQRVIRRNAKDFINKKIALDANHVYGFVYTDIKWIEFIVNQIITNCIKYCEKGNGKVKIYTKDNKTNKILVIEDNGIGIMDKDIKRVFDRGFTGDNGRLFEKSTGMGLYLCKTLCDKLGLKIFINSSINKGTKVRIVFPLNETITF